MKKTILTSATIFYFFLSSAFSQEPEKLSFKNNQVGIQFNPVIHERLLSSGGLQIIDAVFSLRYGYKITKNVTTGIEFSSRFPLNISSTQNHFKTVNYFVYTTGLYARYSFLSEKRFQVFAEASPYFSHNWKEMTSTTDQTSYTDNQLGFYLAPGVTLYSKSRRVSFDLYYKFSNRTFTSHNKATWLSYKINFNF